MLRILRISLGVAAVAVASVRRGPLSKGRTYTEPSSRHRQREPASGSISTPRSLAGAFELRAREETRESRGIPCLFLNTDRGFGGKPPKKSGFRRHLAGSKMPKETFFTAISRWREVSRRALDASGSLQG